MGRSHSEGVGVLETNHPKIINLSSKQLSKPQINLLLKGLKFTPTPRGNKIELKPDINEFTRKLRLAEFFHKEETIQESNNTTPLVKNKSNFFPPKNRNRTLDTAVDFLNEQTVSCDNKPATNLRKEEWNALKELQDDKTIIIKEADKGGSTIIMNTTHYERMVYDLLLDEGTYKKVSNNTDSTVMKRYLTLMAKYKHLLTKDEFSYLTVFRYQTSNFYGLPKIHKSKIISEAINNQPEEYICVLEPSDLKLRPIVAGFNCPTKRVSNFTDILLKPLLTKIKSYIRDNIDFLNKCNRLVTKETVLTSFDVNSLYTSIPHELGLKAIEYWVHEYPEMLEERFNTEFVLTCLSFVLKNNNFLFNGDCFHQLKGTAMGTIVAPTYATFVMGYLEINLYKKVGEIFDEETQIYIENHWDRILDDCFITLDPSKITPEQLLEVLNNLHNNISFTMESHNISLPFLDINVNKSMDNQIWMDIYHKTTDTRRCLPFYSCHPKHVKHNIPYILARRICTIVENNEIKQKRLEELQQILTSQHYPKGLINEGISKANRIPRNQLRQVKQKANDKKITFISTHNPNNKNIFPTIKEVFKTLQNQESTKNIFSSFNLIRSLRQPPNLKRLLTKAKYDSEKTGSYKCNKPRCRCCLYIQEGDTHRFKTTQKTFTLKSSFNCDSFNLVYVIICQTCFQEYIGETGEGRTVLRDRVRIYVQHIKNPQYQMLKVEEHLRTCGNGNFKILPFFQLKKNDKYLRQQYELHFRKTFKPSLH